MRETLRAAPRRPLRAALLALVLVAALAGCSDPPDLPGAKPTTEADLPDPPKLGACRVLEPADVAEASNASEIVGCDRPHTAETFAIGSFPEEFADTAYDDRALGEWIFRRCGAAYVRFLGGEESMAIRSLLSWAWFRPSEEAWEEGAHWYRCDVVGGPDGAEEFRALPTTAKGFLGGKPPEDWMLCARGEQFVGSAKVPCAQRHDWRAATTVKVTARPVDARTEKGEDEPYPGDRIVATIARNLCSDSVLGYLNYPALDFDYAVSTFGRAEWETGNRRAVCWAKTTR